MRGLVRVVTFFFNDTATTEIYTLSLHDALPIWTKAETKIYRHYTGYLRGLREIKIEEVAERRPEDIVTLAVRRMLPKTRLGHSMLKRLKVYTGADHPHQAQQPVKVSEL